MKTWCWFLIMDLMVGIFLLFVFLSCWDCSQVVSRLTLAFGVISSMMISCSTTFLFHLGFLAIIIGTSLFLDQNCYQRYNIKWCTSRFVKWYQNFKKLVDFQGCNRMQAQSLLHYQALKRETMVGTLRWD